MNSIFLRLIEEVVLGQTLEVMDRKEASNFWKGMRPGMRRLSERISRVYIYVLKSKGTVFLVL